MLTIAIPTFNRHEKLLKTLNKLSQLRGDIPFTINIFDNCSTPPITEYLADKNYVGFEYTKIYKNNGNIGLGANLLLCFVHCANDWMWLLGDDDLPIDTCLSSIFTEIEKANENDFLIKFNSRAGGFPEFDTTLSNEKEFLTFCANFSYYSNMLFISNSIFRVNTMQKHLRTMFEFTNTMAPHIIGILKNVSENKHIKIVNSFITEHGIAQGDENWDFLRLCEGVLYFADLKEHKEFRTKMASNLFLNYIAPKRFFIAIFTYPFRYENYSSEYWSWFYRKAAFLFSGYKSIYLNILSLTIRYYYNSKIINKIFFLRIKSKIISKLDRS